MGRNEMLRPAPKLIQDVFDAQAAEEAEQARTNKEREELDHKEALIKSRIETLLTANITDPETIVLKSEKPKTDLQKHKALSKVLGRMDHEISRKLQLPRAERENEEYQFKVEFPVLTPNGVIDVILASKNYPQGDKAHSMRIDIPILPHTFDIGQPSEYQRRGVLVVSRKDHFVANVPDRLGSPGRNYPEYSSYISLEQANQITELLEFIEQGVADKTIKPRDLTPKPALEDEARMRQRFPQKIRA